MRDGALPDLGRYRLLVFDLDGTLYRQGPLRRRMLAELLAVGGPPGRLQRLRVLRRFRSLREEIAHERPRDFDAPLFARLSAETGWEEAALRALVAEWMERRPLRHLAAARIVGAPALFDRLRAAGTATAIWSDYPVAGKAAALSLHADHAAWAGDPEVRALKPDPAGLLHLMERADATPAETLMVGDRPERDGAAAAAAGVDFLLRADRAPRGRDPAAWRVADFTVLAART